MDCTIILNCCSSGFVERAEELNGFLSAHLDDSDTVRAIVFHDGLLAREEPPNLPVKEFILVEVDGYMPEVFLEELEKISGSENHDKSELYLFSGDFAGEELSARFSRRMGGSVLTGVKAIEKKGRLLECRKPVYSNHLTGIFEMERLPWCVALGRGATDPIPLPERTPGSEKNVFTLDARGKKPGFVVESRFFPSQREDSLENGNFIFTVGRGAGGKIQCDRMREAALRLKAEFGVTRLTAMNGWAPMNRMIGVSGRITNPELCIVAAASGAAAFMAGIEKSGFILSINTDPKAPIVRQSDVAVIADYEAFTRALIRIIFGEDAP